MAMDPRTKWQVIRGAIWVSISVWILAVSVIVAYEIVIVAYEIIMAILQMAA